MKSEVSRWLLPSSRPPNNILSVSVLFFFGFGTFNSDGCSREVADLAMSVEENEKLLNANQELSSSLCLGLNSTTELSG